jgi:hypothetical protein
MSTPQMLSFRRENEQRVTLDAETEKTLRLFQAISLSWVFVAEVLALFMFCDSMKIRLERKFIFSVDAEHGLLSNKVM